jgi:hypothetical protein
MIIPYLRPRRYATDLTDAEWALIKPVIDIPQNGGNRGEPHAQHPRLRATGTGDIGRGLLGGQDAQTAEQRGAQVVEQAHSVGFEILNRAGFGLAPGAEGAGDLGHLVGHLRHKLIHGQARCDRN